MGATNWGICPLCESKAETLREDYKIGIYKGKFYVKYKARCKRCGFHYKFKADRIARNLNE